MIVLVGYASEHGSTRDIAQWIGANFTQHGLRADVRSLDEIGELDDLSRYDAVVLGSAVHDQKWLPGATTFVQRHIDALAARPLWLFSVGMPEALPAPLRGAAHRAEEKKLLAGMLPALHPRDHRLFSGVVRREQLLGAGKLAFEVIGGRFGDFRDWTEIDGWADGVAGELAAGGDAAVR